MDAIRVDKAKLLDILKRNRDQHRAMFLEAQNGYHEEVIRLLDERLADARAGRRINVVFTLPAPIDQTHEYDVAIEMLDMSIDAVVELTEVEFRQFVKDEWHWQQHTTAVNTLYTKKK